MKQLFNDNEMSVEKKNLASGLQGIDTNRNYMTVKELAEVLKVSEDTILNSYKEAILQSEQIRIGKKRGGKPQIKLTEVQATAIKLNLFKNSEVRQQPKTKLEKAILIQEALSYQKEFIEELEAELAEKRPKAAFYDRAMSSSDCITMDKAAQVLKCPYGRNKLFEHLRNDKILKDNNTPYQEYIERGYFVVDERPIDIGSKVKIKAVTKVTQRGLSWLAKKYK